eukprot:gb/GFBE01023128.1/.p1 GENE.gb/GFBE01023128.1/~~gb/GFBE01023128.1/.p1  ORF type:complete len:183 (+),score=33.63 gb/GFBE01023128.1/:1-549(+)
MTLIRSPLRVPQVLLAMSCAALATKDCADRKGGAFVTFAVGRDEQQHVVQWVEDSKFIDHAIGRTAARQQGSQSASAASGIPVFNRILPGSDCDEKWSWHVDPTDLGWVDMTTEVCDASPKFIEKNEEAWISSPGRWCPWTVEILAIEDRRGKSPQVITAKKTTPSSEAAGEVPSTSGRLRR